jgi:hypothetical protein
MTTTYTFDIESVPTDENGIFSTMPTDRCLASDQSLLPCAGDAEVRFSRSGYTATIRCDRHETEHQDNLDHIANRYPDTESAPSWFDPTYAGERWNDDY